MLSETGLLLRVLAAEVKFGVVGEIGTGAGVGTSWLASALQEGVSLDTSEIEPKLAEAVRALFAEVPQVRVIHGDWRKILHSGPFALLFADAAPAKHVNPELLLGALEVGGVVVFDDLTPGRKDDPLRYFWLNDPRLAASEVMVRSQEAVILATRLRRG